MTTCKRSTSQQKTSRWNRSSPTVNYGLAIIGALVGSLLIYDEQTWYATFIASLLVLPFLVNGYLCRRAQPPKPRSKQALIALYGLAFTVAFYFWFIEKTDIPVSILVLPIVIIGATSVPARNKITVVEDISVVLQPESGSVFLKSQRFAPEEIRQIAIAELDDDYAIVQFPKTNGTPEYMFPISQIEQARKIAQTHFQNAQITT